MQRYKLARRPEATLAVYRALAEFRYRIRRFLHFSERAARAAGLEPQQHQLLLAVKGLPRGREATITEVAERLQVVHHSAVELIDRLVARGLVHRCRGEADRRQVFVALTRRGETVLRRLSLHHLAELAAVRPALRRLPVTSFAHVGVAQNGGGALTPRRQANGRIERRSPDGARAVAGRRVAPARPRGPRGRGRRRHR